MANNHTISQRKYDAANCKVYTMKFNRRTDADVIARLDSVPSRQGYLRQLVRKDLADTQHQIPNINHIKEDPTMEKTRYTALIEADDGIHLFRKVISDPTAEYEDFEIAMEHKADDLSGELHVIFADDDIVEDTTLE